MFVWYRRRSLPSLFLGDGDGAGAFGDREVGLDGVVAHHPRGLELLEEVFPAHAFVLGDQTQ